MQLSRNMYSTYSIHLYKTVSGKLVLFFSCQDIFLAYLLVTIYGTTPRVKVVATYSVSVYYLNLNELKKANCTWCLSSMWKIISCCRWWQMSCHGRIIIKKSNYTSQPTWSKSWSKLQECGTFLFNVLVFILPSVLCFSLYPFFESTFSCFLSSG